MKSLFLIAKDGIKKQKMDSFIMVALIAIATMLLYIGVSVISNYKNIIDQRNENVNGADFFFAVNSDKYEELFSIITEKPEVEYSETLDMRFLLTGNYRYAGEDLEDGTEIEMVFESLETERTISTINVIDAASDWKENSIIVPYYMHASSGYNVGDILVISTGNEEYEFEIYGYAEDVLFSTPLNINVSKMIISQEFIANHDDFGLVMHVIKTKCNSDNLEAFEEQVINDLSKENSDIMRGGGTYVTLNYSTMKDGTGIIIYLFMAILILFAILLIVVVLVILRFNIGNSIDENIKNTGIMEACGYTSGQLIMATMLQFGIIGITGMMFGFIFVTLLLPVVANVISGSMGLLWDMKFNTCSATLVGLVIEGFIVFVSVLCARKLKKISPLDALRNGIYSHNFKKNRLKIENSPFEINTTLGLKSTLFKLKKNVVMGCVVAILALVTNVAIASYQNFTKVEVLLQVVGVNSPDIMISGVNSGTEVKDIIDELEKVDGVKKVVGNSDVEGKISAGDNESGIYIDCFEDPSKADISFVVDGRLPEFDNEIIINGLLAEKLGVEIGDTVKFASGASDYEYILVGKCQGITRMGKYGILTIDGMKHIDEQSDAKFGYIYLDEGADRTAVLDNLQEKYKDYTVVDYQKAMDATIGPIKAILDVFCVALVVVSAIVIAFILMLLIKSHITKEKKTMGIYKAIGYTTKQLMLQIMVSYLPIVLFGGLVGCIISKLFMSNLFMLCFSMFSIKKIDVEVTFISYILCILGLVLWSELIAIIASLRIRKIMPYKMITEQ